MTSEVRFKERFHSFFFRGDQLVMWNAMLCYTLQIWNQRADTAIFDHGDLVNVSFLIS